MRKVVTFSSGCVSPEVRKDAIQSQLNNETKSFSVSDIKNRLREDKRGVKVKFRNMIKDYRQLFKSAKPDDVNNLNKLFRQDLTILLSEAINNVEKGSTLNKELMLTSVVPSTKKISNKLNALVKRIGAFYKKNGYINKQYQLQFNEMFKELVKDITEAVYKDEVIEEELENPGAKTVDMNPTQSEMKVAASATKSNGRVIMYAASENIDKILSENDFDDDGLEDVNIESLSFSGGITTKLNELAKSFNGCKLNVRVKAFSSELIPVSFVVKDNGDSVPDQLLEAINQMTIRGCLSVKDKSYNYDCEWLNDGNLKYTIYVDKSKLACTQNASESNGIYVDSMTVPDDYKTLFGPITENPLLSQLERIFDSPEGEDGNLSTMQELEIEEILAPVDEDTKSNVILALQNKYPESLWSNVF